MSDQLAPSQLSPESFDLMKDLVGAQAALMTMDLMTEESKLRYRSFYPCGDMLIGLRYAEPRPDGKGFKPGRSLKIMNGKIVSEPRQDVQFTPPLVPHHAEHVYGFWHINDQQEMVIGIDYCSDSYICLPLHCSKSGSCLAVIILNKTGFFDDRIVPTACYRIFIL